MLDANQKELLAALFAKEHVAVFVTQGDEWPTATMQAFAETPELDLLFIMIDSSDKFQNAYFPRTPKPLRSFRKPAIYKTQRRFWTQPGIASLPTSWFSTEITGSALAGTSSGCASMRTLFTWLRRTPGKSIRYGETCFGSKLCAIASKLSS